MIKEAAKNYQIKVSSFTSVYTNESTDEEILIENILQYFQPRSKLKGIVSIQDEDDALEEISSKHFQMIGFNNQTLEDELKLGAKSNLKQFVKNQLCSDKEADGYLNTVNVLLSDIVERIDSSIPLKYNNLNFDSIVKQISINTAVEELNLDSTYTRNSYLLPLLVNHLLLVATSPLLLCYYYPESELSTKEQMQFREILDRIAEKVPLLIVTSSKYFLARNYEGINYYASDKQVLDDEFIENLIWDSPEVFEEENLKERLQYILSQYIDLLEINPSISNFEDADIILFKNIDLYILIYLMHYLNYNYHLSVDHSKLSKATYRYIMDSNEKI